MKKNNILPLIGLLIFLTMNFIVSAESQENQVEEQTSNIEQDANLAPESDLDQKSDSKPELVSNLEEPIKADDSESIAPDNISSLKLAISKIMQEKNIPAVGIAMLDESGPVWVGALGLADIEKQTAADQNSLFRIGSTSKMFVALSILQLVEQGKLSLTDKVADLVPEIEFQNSWEQTNPVLVVHLLEHTTGWDDIHLPEYANNDPTPISLKQGLDFHPHSRTSRWVPGTRSSYCNSGPPVAAYIVEKITGQPFEDYVQTNFFDPLGMAATTYFLDDNVQQKGVTLYDNANHPQDYWHIIMRPSGSINASPLDMSKFLAFYLNRGIVDGQSLVTEGSLKRMEKVESTNAAKVGQQAGYGLNNYSSAHKSWTYREHNGGVNGGLTELAYLPSAKLGHVIMINSGNGQGFREISQLIRNYETRNLDAQEPTNQIAVNQQHRAIEGLYYPINSRQKMSYFLERVTNVHSFHFDGDKLIRESLLGSTVKEYYPLTETLYRSSDNSMSSLSVTNDPLVGRVLHLNNTVYQPTNGLFAYGQLLIGLLWLVSIVSSILFLFVWGIRKLDGKVPSGGATRIRLWPLLAGLSVISFGILVVMGANDPFKYLGEPTGLSVGAMLSTIAFAIFSFMSLYTAIKERQTPMNRVAYWYCTVSSSLHFLLTLYLMWFGVIGLMTWA